MTVSIISCPSCKSMVLSDTIQCPTCQHVLKPERMQAAPAGGPTQQRQQKPAPKEEECTECGEMVRVGLVRCWNCGTFMRKDIAESYRKMQESPSDPILSDPSAGPVLDGEDAGWSETSTAAGSVDPDDFELAPDIAAQASDDDFEIDAPFAPQKTAESKPRSESGPSESEATKPAEAPETAAESDSSEQRASDKPDEATAPHSVTTGGDVLWKVAMQEEAETKKRRAHGGRRGRGPVMTTRGGFLVYCPHGHRIEVQERHRGQSGRCPRCKAVFIVPEKPWDEEAEKVKQAAEQAAREPKKTPAKKPAYQYNRWMTDVHVHSVDPQKLKLKPGSLAGAYQLIDLGFSRQGMLMVVLAKKSGLFGSIDKTKLQAARESMLAHLEEGQPLDDLPAAEKTVFDAVDVRHIRVVQPVRYEFESMFAGVPVFGEGRIAVHLPKGEEATHPQFASFVLSEFRQFARILEDLYAVKGLGEECDVPLTDSFTQLKCHYTDEALHTLEHVEFYQADPNFELKLIGRRCQSCGLAVSEDARKKEKIGGPSGKGIAKATCPKCKGKFGDVSLYAIEKAPELPPASDEEPWSEESEGASPQPSSEDAAAD